MSARWWELWSPGLQAVGGVVELVGVGLLAYEWWKASRDALDDIDPEFRSAFRKFREAHSIKTPREMGAILSTLTDRERDFIAKSLPRVALPDFNIMNRRKIYKDGFMLLVLGVIFQVVANGIAWAGAYGLFR